MILLLLLLVPAVASAQSIEVAARGSNDPITVTVTRGVGASPLDWVALTPSVSSDASYVNWFYLNGSKSAPGGGVAVGSVTFPRPASGSYNVRLYANNSLAVKLATSETITVGTGQAPAQTIVFNGDSITAPYNIQGAQNWTAIVAERLGYTSALNLATSGKYASEVLAEAPLMNGQVCMVMIGTNDMAGSLLSSVPADVSREGYLSIMRQLVAALKTTCGRVVVLSPPLSLLALEAVRYPAWIDGLRLACVEQGATFLDLFHHMADLAAILPYETVSGWFSDARHLTVAGHAVVGAFVSRSLTVTP